MFKITDKSITFKIASNASILICVFALTFCALITYFSAMPLLNGTHSEMPRTFFAGISLAGIFFAAFMVKSLMHHCVSAKIDCAAGRVFEKWRSFGGTSDYNRALSRDAYITVEKQERYYKNANGVGYTLRNVCDIVFYNTPYKALKIHSGIVPEEANEIIAFFENNGIEQRKVKTPMNKWVLGGTLLFMAALFLELYKMGALS